MTNKTIEERVAISLAVGRYLRATERFEAANTEFADACQAFRSVAIKPDRYVCNVQHSHYLVEVQENGDFKIEQLDCL